MRYLPQINETTYKNTTYISIARWSTYSLVIEEIMKINPHKILEIGPGNGIVSEILTRIGYQVKTLDFENRINPDYIMDITDDSILSLEKENFDLILASEVLEHIEYSDFKKVISNLKKITKKLIITLPYTNSNSLFFYFCFKLPLLRRFYLSLRIKYKSEQNKFNGQHYWEIGKTGFSLKKITNDIGKAGWNIEKKFFNYQNPYHYFFYLRND